MTYRAGPHKNCVSLAVWRANLVAATNCSCRACALKRVKIEEKIRDLEAAAAGVPPPSADDALDPILLAGGIRAPKAKRSTERGPAERIAAAKRFSELRKFNQTTEGIAREQTRMDRIWGARGGVVRG